MITAEQARKIATSSKTQERIVNKELKYINKYIKEAARRGEMSIFYEIDFCNYKSNIMNKLQEVGYCVRDGYDCNVIKIDWSETK